MKTRAIAMAASKLAVAMFVFALPSQAGGVQDLLKLRETGTAKDIPYLESVISSNLPPTHIYPFAAAEALFHIGTPEAHQVLKKYVLTPNYNAAQGIRYAFHWDMPEPQRSAFIEKYHLVNLAKDMLVLLDTEPPTEDRSQIVFTVKITNYGDQPIQLPEQQAYLGNLLHFRNGDGQFVRQKQTVQYKLGPPRLLTLAPRQSHTYRIEAESIFENDKLILDTKDVRFDLGKPGTFTVRAMVEQQPVTAKQHTRDTIENPWVGRAVSAGEMVEIPRRPLGVKLEVNGTEITAQLVNDSKTPQTYKGGLGMRNSRHCCTLILKRVAELEGRAPSRPLGVDGIGHDEAWPSKEDQKKRAPNTLIRNADGKTYATEAPPRREWQNYEDIVVPPGKEVLLGSWNLADRRYSEGDLVRGAGQLNFSDLPAGKYQVHWWDGVFQLGAPLRSVPVELAIKREHKP